MNQRILSSFVCLLLLTSIAPTAAAVGPSDSAIWGISYDWGDFEDDVLDMTGVDTNAVNEDLELAADYAGFDLDSDQVLSGSSHFFIESWDDDETVEIQDIHGNTHQVTKRVTELTVRHGLLTDVGFTAAWIDNNESIDIWYSASQEMVLVIDATYVEYVDSDLLVYGADLEMSGVVSNAADLSMNLQVIAAGEVEAPEVDLGYSISMEVPSLSSEWRVDHPLDYLQQLNQEPSESNEDGIFTCDNGEEIPASWENDGEADCYDGSDEADGTYTPPSEMPETYPEPSEGSSLSHILETGELRYCVDPYYPPFESYDNDGELEGFDVDISTALADRLSQHYGVNLEFVPVESDWDPIIPNLMGGEMCDAIISAMTTTEERGFVLDFTRGFVSVAQGVIGADGSPTISDVFELDAGGTTIAVQSGTTSDWWSNDYFSDATIIAYESYNEVIMALDNGDVDYAMHDASILSVDGDIMTTFSEENMGVALREGNNELLTALDVAITDLVNSEEYDDIYSTWFEGEPYLINDWTPDQDIGWQEGYEEREQIFVCDSGQEIPADWVNDGEEDCYDGSDESGEFNSGGGIIEGTFTTLTGYSLSVGISGIPTEEIGVNLDTFNVELSDNVPGQGAFSENFQNIEGQMAEWNWDCPPVSGNEDLTIDDTAVEVQCGLAAPLSPGMAVMLAQSLAPAFDNGIQELSSVLQEQIESWMEEISGDEGGDGIFVCDNGEEIPASWENDGEVDCSDGSDENGGGGDGVFVCDNGEEIPASWVNDGEADCSDGSDENDDSMGGSEEFERLESMMEALMESNLEKTMGTFAEKLDELLEDNIPSDPVLDLEESCALLFWTTDDSRVVGFAVLNSGELLLGPSIFGVNEHDIDLNVQYYDGDNARAAKIDILGITELRDIAPESKHDNSLLYEILGPDYLPNLDLTDTDGDGVIDYFDQDDDGDGISDWDDPELNKQKGSLPAPGVLAVISMLGAATILMPRKDD